MSEEPEKTVTLQITVPPEWTPGDKLRARLPGGVKVVVNAPASTKVGDTLEFELPASVLNEDADERLVLRAERRLQVCRRYVARVSENETVHAHSQSRSYTGRKPAHRTETR